MAREMTVGMCRNYLGVSKTENELPNMCSLLRVMGVIQLGLKLQKCNSTDM